MISIDLTGQTAIVTGGSRGIGAATVQLLAEAGAAVVFSYRRERRAADSVLAACAAAAERVAAVRGDAAQPRAADQLVETAARRFGRVDIAIANAGIWDVADTPIERMPPAQWRQTIAVNLDSAYALARAATRQMKRQKPCDGRPRGRLILIASTAGQRGEAGHGHYAASKGGMIALTRGLGTELAGAGILVNAVAPGWVDTDMSKPVLRADRRRILDKIPLARVGRAEEIAGCVLFLCTPWSDFMTSSVLSANGGAVLA